MLSKIIATSAGYVSPRGLKRLKTLASRPRSQRGVTLIELLIALAITAMNNQEADLAMKQLGKLKGSEVHSTVILPEEDKNVFRKLGINVTVDPVYQHKKLYHK